MAVPASYNAVDPALRDHGAVAHLARVWWDGVEVAKHEGGFLPFALIAEAPAVGVNWTKTEALPGLQRHHLAVVEAMVARDANSPSVLVWSLGNEINTRHPLAYDFLAPVAAAKHLNALMAMKTINDAPYVVSPQRHCCHSFVTQVRQCWPIPWGDFPMVWALPCLWKSKT